MASDDLCWLPALELAALIRARKVSPVEVADAVLARIEQVNPALNAFCRVTAEEARDAAQAAEVMVGAIAAAGRSGVEEMYCVQYLDVGCDVCCHVA